MSEIQTDEEFTRAVAEMYPTLEKVRHSRPEDRADLLGRTFSDYLPLLARLGGVADGDVREALRQRLVDQICALQELAAVPRVPVLGPTSSREDVKRRIYQVIKGHRVAAFATVDENGNPRTRYVVAAADEDLNVSFGTSLHSCKCVHLLRNPNAHVCFKNLAAEADIEYVQIEGVARVLQDADSKKAFWNPMLWMYMRGPDDPDYAAVVVTPRRAELCNLVDLKRGLPPVVWEADDLPRT